MQVVLTFSRATEASKFFPVPAILREYSGRAATGDPIAAEARKGLLSITSAMRGPHEPKLLDIPGEVTTIMGECDDKKDERAIFETRKPDRPIPLSRRLEATLVRLGWGIGRLELPSLRTIRQSRGGRIRTTTSTGRTSFALAMNPQTLHRRIPGMQLGLFIAKLYTLDPSTSQERMCN